MNICFVAGGTGGHITPALAVADELRSTQKMTNIFFITSGNSLEKEIFSNHPHPYRQESISTGKLRRYFSLQNIFDMWRIPLGIFEARKLLQKEQPDVIFSKGGYVALPVGFAAKSLKIPFIIHESDTVPGIANRILYHTAKKVLTTFPQENGECVGTPLRSEVLHGNAEKGRRFLGFGKDQKIILVMGGSQGAEALNKLLLHSLEVLTKEVSIVHLAGKGKAAAQDSDQYKSFEYLGKEYPDVLMAADIVISRAGANSIFEFARTRKPTILLPLPSAANNHQWKNALYFAQRNAALVLDQEKITSNQFQSEVVSLVKNTKKQQELSKNIGNLVGNNATKKITQILLKYAGAENTEGVPTLKKLK